MSIIGNMVSIAKMSAVLLATSLLAGCISPVLSTNQFKPVGAGNTNALQSSSDVAPVTDTNAPIALSGEEPISDDPTVATAATRGQAVQEIRAKAQETSGKKTQIGLLPETATEQMTASEQKSKAAELQNAVAEAQSSVSDAEVESKQNSIRRLQSKARSHYSDAVKRIEN